MTLAQPDELVEVVTMGDMAQVSGVGRFVVGEDVEMPRILPVVTEDVMGDGWRKRACSAAGAIRRQGGKGGCAASGSARVAIGGGNHVRTRSLQRASFCRRVPAGVVFLSSAWQASGVACSLRGTGQSPKHGFAPTLGNAPPDLKDWRGLHLRKGGAKLRRRPGAGCRPR